MWDAVTSLMLETVRVKVMEAPSGLRLKTACPVAWVVTGGTSDAPPRLARNDLPVWLLPDMHEGARVSTRSINAMMDAGTRILLFMLPYLPISSSDPHDDSSGGQEAADMRRTAYSECGKVLIFRRAAAGIDTAVRGW